MILIELLRMPVFWKKSTLPSSGATSDRSSGKNVGGARQ
jgi:hypothetical protein